LKGRTDMALEAHQSIRESGKICSGIESELFWQDGMKISRIKVCSKEGEEAIGKPQGTYTTLSTGNDWFDDSNGVIKAAKLLSDQISPLLPKDGTVLVVGLGNTLITPDSLGPLAVDKIIVTRHLFNDMPAAVEGMRSVCAIKAGVLGCTGVETAEIVKGVCSRVSPCAVIAIDALASLSTQRLCRTFQVSDTGIVPGAGACNARRALNRGTLGIPVIALGVPTVVDADTIVADALKNAGMDCPSSPFPDLLVTPKDIDALIEKSAKVLGYAVNIALQGDMTASEIEQFLC